MLIKNDIIKLVVEMPGFDMIGEEFIVVDVLPSGVIVFECYFGRGTMDQDAYEKHFEKIGHQEEVVYEEDDENEEYPYGWPKK